MKRRLLKLAVFLLLGAIVNVAVALGVAWRFDRATLSKNHWFYVFSHPHDRGSITKEDEAWIKSLNRQEPKPTWRSKWVVERADYHPFGYTARMYSDVILISNSKPDSVFDPPHFAQRISAGFPWRCFAADRCFASKVVGMPVTVRVIDGRELPGPTGSKLPGIGVLIPQRLIWLGFAINTLFYALVIWGLFAVPCAIRRTRRANRGLCPACGYPVGESAVCTECGGKLPQVHKSTSPNEKS